MKLADILAAKRKLRCPACQTKLDFVQKRILIATGRCRFCATKVIEDLPPTPEAPRVDLETLQRLQVRVSRQEIMSMVFLVSFLLIGFFALYVSADAPNAPANWMFFAGLGGLYFFFVSFGWIIGKSIQKRKPKCPFCGKTLNVPLLETTGRCCDCGVGLLNLPEPTGKPVITLAEYFRNKTKVNSWTISLLTLLVACFYGFPVLFAPVFGAGCGDMMVLLWLLLNAFFIIVLFIPSMVFVLSRRLKICCPDCRESQDSSQPLPFLGHCRCGHQLVDLDSGDGVALSQQCRRLARRAIWAPIVGLAGFLSLFLFLLWVFPFDCEPVNDADLKPPPCLAVADADNAWTYFVSAWQAVDKTPAWPWDFIDRALSGKEWDETKIGELLARYQPALDSLEKGVARKVCQPPPLSGFLQQYSHRPERNSRSIVELLKLRIERERRQGKPNVAITMAQEMYQYGLLLQSHAEDRIQYQSGHYASHQALLELRRLASEPGISEESLVSAERELRPGSTMAFWAVDLDHMLRKQYVLTCDYLHGVPKDRRYLEHSGDFQNRECFFFSHLSFFYQPNRLQRDLTEYWRRLLAAPGKSTSFIYGKDLWILQQDGRILLFNGLGKAVVSEEVYRSTYGNHYVNGKSSMRVPKHEYMPAEVVLTRALLLCRLYEKKHGQLPETLQELVPEFVEAVPLDPFDGQPVRYSKERQIVYCVGSDGKDDGAPKYEKGWGPQGEYNRLRDQVLELKPKAKEKVDR